MDRYKLITGIAVLLLVPICVWAWGIIGIGGGISYENFMAYTETDPNALITVTSSTISFSAITRNEDAYVYKDFGANFFSADWDVIIEAQFSGVSGSYPAVMVASFANQIDDLNSIKTESDHAVAVVMYGQPGTQVFAIWEAHGGGLVASGYYDASASTTYYLRFKRDDDAGTYGTAYLDIYSSRSNAENETSALANLSQTLEAQTDFQYFYGLQSYNTGNADRYFDGFSQNIEIITP